MTGEANPFGEVRPPEALRVVVADDNPVVRAGLTALLTAKEGVEIVAEAADGREAYEATLAHRPDVVLLDVRMPGVDGLTALPHLVPLTAVLMLTYSGESDIVHEALRRGANGYLVHGEFTPDELVTAVRDARRGRPHLTPTAAGRLLAQLREGVRKIPLSVVHGAVVRRPLGLLLRKTFRNCNRMWHSRCLTGRRTG